MNHAENLKLRRAVEELRVPGLLADHRLISEGDEGALLPEEQAAFSRSVVKVRRASGAARIVARGLMLRLGLGEHPIPKASGGQPVWPDGIVGSLAHDAKVAVAAIARRSDFVSLGIDVEPADPLDAELVPIVATEQEQQALADDLLRARLLFAIKEAIYKAVYPLDGMFLDHHDVEMNFGSGAAFVRGGRVVEVRYQTSPRILALGLVRASGASVTPLPAV